MYTYEQVWSMIGYILQGHLELDNPYQVRDIYIASSRRNGNELRDEELEFMWLEDIAGTFKDNTLLELTGIQNEMSWDLYGGVEVS